MQHNEEILQTGSDLASPPYLKALRDRIAKIPNLPREPTEAEDREDLRRRLNVSSLDQTFANFHEASSNEKAFDAFKKFAAGENDAPILLCRGGVGNGKTHLLEAIAITMNRRMEKWPEFIDLLKSKMSKDYDGYSYDEILLNRKQRSVLLIDDIGLGTLGREWETSLIEELIDYRYHNWLPTAMTTNLELSDFTTRVRDRFTDNERCLVVVNDGSSQRGRAKELHKESSIPF